MTNDSRAGKQKVLFRLEQDEDCYPPLAVEGLWAARQPNGLLVVDNIPFFAREIAPGDTVMVSVQGDEVWFDRLHAAGGASVFRIRVKDEGDLQKVREELLDLGLPSEVDQQLLLLAVEVPPGIDIGPFLNYLVSNQESERLDFEEAALRHPLPE
jgi:hypothetical protein